MPKVVRCPNCNAPLQIEDPQAPVLQCQYCHADVKQTIYQPPPQPPRPRLDRPPLQIEIRDVRQVAQATRNVKVILWVVILSTLLPVGIGAIVAITSARRVGEAVKAATGRVIGEKPPDPEQQLAEKLDVYGDCLGFSNSFHWSRARYLGWVDAKRGPTCKERCIGWGIARINLSRDPSSGCLALLARIEAAPPRLAPLEAAGKRLGAALDTVDRLVEQAYQYYEQKDFLEDGCAKGRELHVKLMPAFESYEKAELEVRAILEREVPALLERRVKRARTEEPGGVKASYLQLALDAHRLLDGIRQVEADRSPEKLAALRARIASLGASLEATASGEEKLSAEARGSRDYFLWPHRFETWAKGGTLELLKAAKEYLRAREKPAAKRGHRRYSPRDDPHVQVLEKFNSLISHIKDLGFRVLVPQRHSRC